MEFERFADKKRLSFITSALQKFIPQGSHVLDIGCGNGIISKTIGELGYHVTAADVSAKTIDHAVLYNSHPNVDYQVVDAGSFMPIPSLYKAIVCSEVLEHLKDPHILVSIIEHALADDGIVIVTVPNGRGPREMLVTRPVQFMQNNKFLSYALHSVKKRLGYVETTIQSSADDLQHLHFFTVKKLQTIAASIGFTIESVSKSNFIEQVFPFSLLTRKSYQLQKADCSVADALPLAFTSGFMMIWRKI
jgi:2-polyprenyl-3-methyl-5-hydroxy-6-metoxy-1,4-benzoquinol methylase